MSLYPIMRSEPYSVGDILRYSYGSTALMQVTHISLGHGGSLARYYGVQCMGGVCGAYHDKCEPASEADITMWNEQSRWRRWTTAPEGRSIIGAVED